MKNNLENSFISKFDLLNSQEDSVEIIWSSDSSDYENCINVEKSKISKQICQKKRKRVVNKSKHSKNISQLEITFIETEHKNKSIITSSPECSRNKSPKISCKSPILTSSQRYTLKNVDKSPIIVSKSKSCNYKGKLDIPGVSYKHVSSISSPKVKKKLFSPKNDVENITCDKRSRSPILFSSKKLISTGSRNTKQIQNSPNCLLRNIQNTDNRFKSLVDNIANNFPLLQSNLPLIEKTKSYFDSHFRPNTSQSASISECDIENETNSSKSMEDIEIIDSQQEKLEPIVKSESNYTSNSLSCESNTEISKKVKYKKDGLAFRLNALKKKQNASTSLWLHERFLATNSNFILPNDDYIIFRIANLSFKYGSHLIEVLDVNNEKYFIILNNVNVHNNNMKIDDVFKLYKPYNILECTNYKLIVNVSKYESVALKSNK